jgi:hypothetical protein
MAAMHDDVWETPADSPDDLALALQEALTERDAAATSGRPSGYLDQRVRDLAAERERRAVQGERGRWAPDKLDQRVNAIIDYRDRIAASVDGPVPEYGSPEWAHADPETQAASAARHERAVAAAQGEAISNRMAAATGERQDLVDSSHAVSAYWRAHRESMPMSARAVEQRAADRERRQVSPKPWEAGYAESFPAKECLQPDPTAAAVARAHEACRDAVNSRQEVPEQTRWDTARDDVDVAVRERV